MEKPNIFNPIKIPDAADKAILFRLWVKLRSGKIERFDKDDLYRHLLALINERVTSRSWMRTLRQKKIEPEDAGAYVAHLLWKKLPTMEMRSPCELTLISYLMNAINNLLISRERQTNRKSEMHASQQPERWGANEDHQQMSSDVDGLIDHLRTTVEDNPMFDEATKSLYTFLVNQIASGDSIPCLDRMPKHLSANIGADTFAVAVYRVNKEVSLYAESLV